MQVLHDETESDDVLQEVFLQVWDRAHSYSSRKGKLMSWLCTLARRRAIDRLRQQSAYRRATDRYEVSCNETGKDVSQSHTVEHEAFRDDLRSLLREHLGTLPPNQQEVIRLAFFEEKSQREISAITRTPFGTVKTRIELGIKKLSHALGGCGTRLCENYLKLANTDFTLFGDRAKRAALSSFELKTLGKRAWRKSVKL